MASLRDHTTDVALSSRPIQIKGLASEIILRQKIMVVVPAAHPLAKLKRIPVARLGELRLVRPSPATPCPPCQGHQMAGKSSAFSLSMWMIFWQI